MAQISLLATARRTYVLALTFFFACTGLAHAAPSEVARWTRIELTFQSTKERKNPLQEVDAWIDFSGPDGKVITQELFWDGERTFRARFLPGLEGTWKYATRASDTTDPGLHGQSGTFQVVPYKGKNPLYQKGLVRRSDDRQRLVYADGTPFFFLADTVWAGPMLSTEKDWDVFLKDRAAKRFNAVQVMGTQNIVAAADATGRQAFFLDGNRLGLEPAFWRRMDARFDAANEAGLLIVPSFSWAASWAPAGKMLDPGYLLPESELVRLLRYAQARYGAHHLIWFLGGDIDYSLEAEKWRRVGRTVFGVNPRHLVSMHPAPRKLHFEDFWAEPWLGFLGYQSSHSNNEKTHRWMTEGEPAVTWQREPRFPIINIEPNYEAHRDGHLKTPVTAYDVRRSAWWSVLVSPTAGVSYGAHGLWSWESTPNLPMSHPQTGVTPTWSEALKLPGSAHMKVLVDTLTATGRSWFKLIPAPALVVDQPGKMTPANFVAAAASSDGTLAVLYFPAAGRVTLDLARISPAARAFWVDPTTGKSKPAPTIVGGGRPTVEPPVSNARGDGDHILILEAR